MSHIEAFTGKLKLVAEGEQAAIKYSLNYCVVNEVSTEDLYDDILEFMSAERPFVYANENLYEVIQKKDFDDSLLGDEDVFQITKTDEREYDFVLRYYNGNMPFEEAVETGLNQMQ